MPVRMALVVVVMFEQVVMLEPLVKAVPEVMALMALELLVMAEPEVTGLLALEPLVMEDPEVTALIALEPLVIPLVVVVMGGHVLVVVLARYGP